MNSSFLIINADDAGLHPDIDAGILDAVTAGTVTSISLFVNGPYVPDIRPFLDAGVSLGLHFNLTQGHPCSDPVPASLVDKNGAFFCDGHERLESFNERDVHKELGAQLARFIDIAGAGPSHLDAHKHLHRRGGAIFTIMLEAAGELGIPLRCPTDMMKHHCRRAGVATADHFIGAVDPAPYWTEDRIAGELSGLSPGITEMMCHPGRKTGPIEGLRYVAQRDTERKALLSGRTKELLAGLRLTNFREAFFGVEIPL